MASTPRHLLTDTGTIQRATTAVDSSGFPAISWADHLTNLPFRFQQMSGTEVVRYGRENTRRMWRCFTTPTHDITEDDRITFDDMTHGGTAITRTLDIQELRDPQLAGTLTVIIGEETD